jgi:hypothetical protein
VCALHEHTLHTLRKLYKKFKSTNKLLWPVKNCAIIFQRVKVPCTLGSRWEVLTSHKLAYREVRSEGSETVKSGTDEQERHKRHIYLGK